MGIKIYYYWYFDEVLISMVLKYTNGSIPVDPNITKDTKTYTSIADAKRNAPKCAEQLDV